MSEPIRIGAVAYDARVVPIWEAMRDYFRDKGPAIDYVLFSHYDRQVEALLAGQVDIAWNTNLAWVKVYRRTNGACRALALRDVDIGFRSVLVARTDSGIAALDQVRGKRLALGSADSAQAAILPIYYLQKNGIDPERECRLLRFDLDVGKHGDTGGSEREVLRALREGRADAGAMAESTWQSNRAAAGAELSLVWTSPGYSHCNFTALAAFAEDRARHWTDSLLAMRYDDPRWRPLMDMEGLRKWVPATPEALRGYDALLEATEAQLVLYDGWLCHTIGRRKTQAGGKT